MKGIKMTDITKYRNVSLTHRTYKTLIALSKVLLPDAQLSISKTIEEQRKQLLQYMWARPYGEVATHIAMLASLVPNKPTESKDDKSKKDLS